MVIPQSGLSSTDALSWPQSWLNTSVSCAVSVGEAQRKNGDQFPHIWEEPELCDSELLQNIRRLMPNLIAVCLDLSPQERTLESENRRGGSWSSADDQAVEPPEPSCPDDCPHCHAYDEYDYYGSDVDEREPEAY